MFSVPLKMLTNFTVFLIVTSVILIDEGQAEIESKLTGDCVLPPFPTNGYYVSSVPDGTPGDIVNDFVLNVTCLPSYNLVGNKQFQCLNGWTSGFMPECLPYCDTNKQNHVVSCDANALRCVLDTSAELKSASTPNNELECGDFGPVFEHVIAGGHRAAPQEVPWHAGIYKKTTTPYMQICGGSLVSSNVIISAAHCFWNDVEKLQPASRYAVAVGKLYRPWNNEQDVNAQKSDVSDIKIPARYHGSATNFQDDIALVILTEMVTFNEHVKPVCLSFDHLLDEKQLKNGNYGQVAGWGLTGEDDKASQVLKVVELPYVDIQKCIAESPAYFTSYITSDKICAGYTNGTAVCRGDSGGGLVFAEEINYKTRHFLRGIVSTAPSSDHACNIYTWGTFTHLATHERFIRSSLRAGVTEDMMPPVTEMIDARVHFHTANLMNHATRKPVQQWV